MFGAGQQIHDSCQAQTEHCVTQRDKCKPRWLTEEEVAALGATPEAMRQHGIHDAVLTELQYARCFWETPQICCDHIFNGLKQQLASFLLLAMVNVTYQRAVRLFSDGGTGELKYSPLTPELRAFRRPLAEGPKADLETRDMQSTHHPAVWESALQVSPASKDGCYHVNLDMEALQQFVLTDVEQEGLKGLVADLGEQMVTYLSKNVNIEATFQDNFFSFLG